MPEHTAPEQRTIDVDVTDVDTRGRTVIGFAAVYNVPSEDLGGFREQIAPGAFRDVIGADVRALLNHDPNEVLGRTRAGTLRLADDQRGLRFELDLPDSPLGENVRTAIGRGDLDGASFRFEVGEESWDGDLRTVRTVKELRDVTLATYPAYPTASVELRTRPDRENNGGSAAREEGNMPAENQDGAAEERSVENESGESRTEENTETERTEENTGTEERTEERSEHRTGTLRVEERSQGGPSGLAAAFRAQGWPGERATLDYDTYRAECRALSVAGDTNAVSQVQHPSAALGYDQRFAHPAFAQVAVDRGVTSVVTLRQTTRELAASGVVRDIDEVAPKSETDSTVQAVPISLKQVASVETGVPNVYLEQGAIRSVIETDLRYAVDDGLDGLVLDAIGDADNQDPASDPLLVSIRKAITLVQAAGYSANTLILPPDDAESLDVLQTDGPEALYVFGAGRFAPGQLFGLNVRVSKAAPAPAVVDAAAFGRLYASPVSLATFEENAGGTNTSTVRLELHAAFGLERVEAAIRIAAS